MHPFQSNNAKLDYKTRWKVQPLASNQRSSVMDVKQIMIIKVGPIEEYVKSIEEGTRKSPEPEEDHDVEA